MAAPPYKTPPKNPYNKGNVFGMNIDGTGFDILHEFTGGANDGWKPWSGLTIRDKMIYGGTVYGGAHGEKGGVLYEMYTDCSDFNILHTFGGSGDGYGLSTSPTLADNSLYGLTRWGYISTGTIYSFDITQKTYK